MKFDRTNGKTAKYVLTIYGERVEDHYYYHYYKEADKHFDQLLRCVWDKGTILSIYDLKKDVQKNFIKF